MSDIRNVWNDTLTTILLDEYERNEYLWNAFSPYYTNKKKREEGYNRIIEALNSSAITIKDVKMKLKNLRSSYSLELKKIRDSRLNGEKEYVPKVFWFYKMDGFLRDVVVPQDSIADFRAEVLLEPKEEFITSDPIEFKPLCSKLATKKRKHHEQNKEKRKKQCMELLEDPNQMHISNPPTPITPRDGEDEFDAFGRNLAHQLRTLPLDVALRLQIRLQTLVAEARLALAGKTQRVEIFENVPCHFEFDLTNQSDELHHNT